MSRPATPTDAMLTAIDWLFREGGAFSASRAAPQHGVVTTQCGVCEGPVEPLSGLEEGEMPCRGDHQLCRGCWT